MFRYSCLNRIGWFSSWWNKVVSDFIMEIWLLVFYVVLIDEGDEFYLKLEMSIDVFSM